MGALSRLGFVLALGLVVALSWDQLVRHAAWLDYVTLAEDIRRGAAGPSDLERVAPLLARETPEACAVLRSGAPVLLHLYASDARARRLGVNPFLPAEDPDLTATRHATQVALTQALACAPMDGDLWLSLALVARALDAEPEQVAHYLALSERYAPHEGWISRRRAQLF
jgi:hypothetical protein